MGGNWHRTQLVTHFIYVSIHKQCTFYLQSLVTVIKYVPNLNHIYTPSLKWKSMFSSTTFCFFPDSFFFLVSTGMWSEKETNSTSTVSPQQSLENFWRFLYNRSLYAMRTLVAACLSCRVCICCSLVVYENKSILPWRQIKHFNCF